MTEQTNEKTLVIDLSEEYKIKIEEPKDLGNSFFKDIYQLAAKAVDDIIEQTEKNTNETDENDPFFNEKQDYNNIIAFCGERGTGKSSAMISFAQSLLKLNDSKNFYTEKKLITKNFHTIHVIDPSLFEEHENIFEVILAQLFSSFEKELNKKEKDSKLNAKRELLEQFEKVYENLQTIKKNGQKYDGEALETLNKLACGANLRQNFKELVKRYLDFIVGKEEKEEKNNAYLIIPIDDFDLNVNAAAEMAEQIRKYLMIPHVIILMAVKIEQLADAKEQQIRKEFRVLIKAEALVESPKNITQQYIVKLIPSNRRIDMPKLENSLIGNKLAIKKSDKIEYYNNIFDGFRRCLYFRTKFLISLNDFLDIEIFPKTLRELKEFFIVLLRTETVNDIIHYAINLYKRNNTDKSYILENLLILPDCNRNHFIIKSIYLNLLKSSQSGKTIINREFERFTTTTFSIFEIIDKETKEFNVTLGDLLVFFKAVEESKFYFEFKELINYIKFLYSIWLSDYYKNKEYSKIIELTNGSIYNPALKQLFRNAKYSRFPLNENIKVNEKDIVLSKNNSDLSISELSMIDWLVYFIEYSHNSSYKKQSSEYYKREIGLGTGQFSTPIFNILHFSCSVLDPELNNKRGIRSLSSSISSSDETRNFMEEMVSWHRKHVFALPFNNIFAYERLLWEIDVDYKEKAKSYSSLVIFLFTQIQSFLRNLEDNDDLLKKEECVLNSFESCPIVKPIIERAKSYLDLLDSINPDVKIEQDYLPQTDNELIIKVKNDIKGLRAARTVKEKVIENQDILNRLGLFDQIMEKFDLNESHQSIKDFISTQLDKKLSE